MSGRAGFEASSLAPVCSKQREQQMQRPGGGNRLVVFKEENWSQCGWNEGAEREHGPSGEAEGKL